jgi:hypothetical protein
MPRTRDAAVFPGVWVQPGKCEPWRCETETRQLASSEIDRALEHLAGQCARNLRERDVHGREDHAERLRVEHHRHARRTRQVREEIRVASPRQSRGGKCFLVDRRRGNGINAAGLRVAGRLDNRVIRRATRPRRDAAPLVLRGVTLTRRAVQDDLACGRERGIGRGLSSNLGPDTRGIAHRDPDARPLGHPQVPHPPEPHVPQPPPPPGPVGLLQVPQPPSSAQPPCLTPLPFGSS